jgi:endonuclease/exonuclease/phosphatase family metal-dependent hydrolase
MTRARLLLGTVLTTLIAVIAPPVSTAAAAAGPALHFVTGEIPLRNVRAGADYHATVGGLALGGDQAPVFRKTGGASWVVVANDGDVTGRPPADATGTATVKVEARDSLGQRTTAALRIPVRPAGARLVPRLKVLSFNLWYGGTKVDDGRAKQLKILLESNVDAVGLQEHMGTSAQALAQALGWYYHVGDNRVGIISRYPITDREAVDSPIPCCIPGLEDFSENVAISARIRIDDRGDGEYVELWNTHHPAELYGPYAACFGGWPEALLLAQEELARGVVMRLLVNAMTADLADADVTPVLLTGDFNAPSHLDYTPATAEKHCGYDHVAWTSSRMAEQAGLTDTFRAANPDPAAVPGNTWSPITPVYVGGQGWDAHIGEPEPQDRIDFVYQAGGMKVLDSTVVVVGDPVLWDHPDVRANEWPSDHAAVLTTFQVG